jgi:hypothetical protein
MAVSQEESPSLPRKRQPYRAEGGEDVKVVKDGAVDFSMNAKKVNCSQIEQFFRYVAYG